MFLEMISAITEVEDNLQVPILSFYLVSVAIHSFPSP